MCTEIKCLYDVLFYLTDNLVAIHRASDETKLLRHTNMY